MFWKIAGPDRLKVWARRKSIARRLALLHILAVFVSYTVFGALFYGRRISQKEKVEAREVAAEIAAVKNILREPNARQMLDYEMRARLLDPDSTKMYIRIVNRAGRTLVESPGMGRLIPLSIFEGKDATDMLRWQTHQGDHYLLQSAPLPDGIFGSRCQLQIATNSNDRTLFQAQLRWTLLLFVLSGTVFAFVCARLIVHFGLKPLDDISRTASSITRRDLHTRIDESSLPDELLSLAHSFNSMLARLEDSFDRLSHYSGNLAHELRTPINTLMIAADISLSRERSAEEYRGVLNSSLEELGRMSNTIDKMLFLARADIEQPNLAVQRLEAAVEIENLFDYYSDAAGDCGVTLQSSGAATVYADETLFRRALSNLISNSLAHTPPGGCITVTFRECEEGSVVVSVRDNGCGIEEEHLPKLFDRFYRVPGTEAKRATEGTGLGLSIVKAVMQMHGGRVAVASQPCSGTEVTLTFPPAPVSDGS